MVVLCTFVVLALHQSGVIPVFYIHIFDTFDYHAGITRPGLKNLQYGVIKLIEVPFDSGIC